MEKDSTTTNASGSEFPQTGATAHSTKCINMLGDIFSTIVPEEPETTEAAPSNAAADPECQVARAASENPDSQGQATAHNLSPAEPVTAEPTSRLDDLSKAGATKDEASTDDQISAAPSKGPDDNLLLTAGGNVKRPAELNEIGWFDPFVPPVPAAPAPKPAPEPKPRSIMPVIDQVVRDCGLDLTPTDTPPESAAAAPAPVVGTGHAEIALPSGIPTAPLETPLPPRVATATELFTWIKRILLARTHLSDDSAELAAFWAISAWFWEETKIRPCLVLTGSAHDGIQVLHALHLLCPGAVMLAGLGRRGLDEFPRCRTILVSEPHLNRRTADLLSCLTDREFFCGYGGSVDYASRSMAVYAGEDPATHKIQNAIHLHLTLTNAGPAASTPQLQEMMNGISVHLDQYRASHRYEVRRRTWTPSGLSSEAATLAAELGRCLVDAPKLRLKLVALLQTRDTERVSDLANTNEAIVLEAALALIRDGRQNAYAREIAAAANHLIEARGETARLRPENVGHTLKGIGLRAHRLSQTGNGLTFDKATIARIHELATMYMLDVMEDTPAETENLPSPQAAENNTVE